VVDDIFGRHGVTRAQGRHGNKIQRNKQKARSLSRTGLANISSRITSRLPLSFLPAGLLLSAQIRRWPRFERR
jgi:hypothetical protein